MERRRERSGGLWMLAAALILTGLAAWLAWTLISDHQPGEPAKNAVLVCGESEGSAHG